LRLSRVLDPEAEGLYIRMCRALAAEGPGRAASTESAELWRLLADGASPPIAESERGAEDMAAEVVTRRLELLAEPIVTALAWSGAPARGVVYIRPLRSRLHAAITMPAGEGSLIIVDDAVVDLTHSVVRWMFACWAPLGGSQPDRGTPIPLNDATRIVRAELGSVRWNGSLWQPVIPALAESSRGFATVVGELAIQFIIAHELGHIVLGHVSGPPESRGATAELDADRIAVEALRGIVRPDDPYDLPSAQECDALVRLVVTVALGVTGLVSATYLVAGDEHPSAEERVMSACRLGGVAGPAQPLERPAEMFFEALDGLVLSSEPSITALVEASPRMSMARAYRESELAELVAIDRIESLFHAPLETLLGALGEMALGEIQSGTPDEVTAAARRADVINMGQGGARPVPTQQWIRCAAGRWWLMEWLLASRASHEAELTLAPAPGTRFCDWGRWVETVCPEDLVALVLAALHVYVRHGPEAEGLAMGLAGLDTAVARWLNGLDHQSWTVDRAGGR